jgi:predicted Rossmann fold flavoprotein
MQSFDVVIIGAGAAGLMCSAGAYRRGRGVLMLEKSPDIGRKIRISGGGHANFTNLHATPSNFLSENPHFCVSALARYTQHDFITLVERHGIAYHERNHGQLFCDGSAQQIIDMLLAEARGIDIQTATTVTRITKEGDTFSITTDRNTYTATSLVIATGGPSIPKMGASRFAYGIANQFGLKVVEPRPGLVPLTFERNLLARLSGLSGVSLDAAVTHEKTRFEEALLFTHRGLSGPVILQISSYWRDGEAITVDLLPGEDAFDMLKELKSDQPRREIQTALAQNLPKRLAVTLAEWHDCNGRLAEIADRKLRTLGDQINRWQVTPAGSEGERTAEVTIGGVDTRELSSKTLEARSVPGLYFIGEAVDVTGHLGGFNFQWAWASGHACGQAV